MEKIEGVLNKILEIQHPERVKPKEDSTIRFHRQGILPVFKNRKIESISLLDTSKESISPESNFFGMSLNEEKSVNNSIRAFAYQNQVLTNGSIIKLCLEDEIEIAGTPISAGTFLYGLVSLNGERLEVRINSIRSDNSIYPVKLEVFDSDGLPGIYIPGAIGRDVVKQSTDNAFQSVELNTLDPSLKAQATAAGVNTAKAMLTKKVKLVRVTVKAGYRIFLKSAGLDQ